MLMLMQMLMLGTHGCGGIFALRPVFNMEG
jgi:hypothetical protein